MVFGRWGATFWKNMQPLSHFTTLHPSRRIMLGLICVLLTKRNEIRERWGECILHLKYCVFHLSNVFVYCCAPKNV